MEIFDIAKLHVQMHAHGDLLHARTRAYLSDFSGTPDIRIDLPEAFFEKKQAAFPHLSLDECRYIWTGEAFYKSLLAHDGLMLHASCVEKDGFAYLFSAKSGTGKSTHTHLWLQAFSDSRILNDDKPALRKIDGRYFACGTPFSGKFDESVNAQVPVRALVFLERAAENKIEWMPAAQAIPLFLSQTLRPAGQEKMAQLLDILDELLKAVPVFRLQCNMELSAAQTAFAGIEAYYNRNGANK